MKFMGKKLMFGLAAGALAVACSSGHVAPTGSSNEPANVGNSADGIGQVGMSLTLPGGEHYSKLTYKLSNVANGGNVTIPGSYDITQTGTLSFTIGSVPAGTGYQLTLSTTSDDGVFTCAYPQTGAVSTDNITVVNRTTTTVNVNLQCINNQGNDAGSLLVNATESQCPVWNTIVANPLNILVDAGQNVNNSGSAGSTAFFPGTTGVAASINDGQQLVLVGSATAPNPGALAFNWTVSAGGASISNAVGTLDPNSTDAGVTNQTVFTCPPAPATTTTYTVTLTLNDGSDAAACDPKFTTGTVQVTCSNPAACGGAPFASSNGGTCIDQTTHAAAGNDPAGFPYVTTGATDPANPGDFCCAGQCGDGTLGSLPVGGVCPAGQSLSTSGAAAGCCVALQPCTVAGQTGCVSCTGSTNGVCTADEAFFVAKDITQNKVTAPIAATGTYPTASCYACLVNHSCVDSPTHHVAGVECDDFTGNFTNGSGASVPAAATCQAVLHDLTNASKDACVFGNAGVGNDTFCYCGTGGYGTGSGAGPTACAAAPAASMNGTDITDELAGFGSTSPGTNLGNYNSDATEPSAVANALAECARGSGTTVATAACAPCFQ
jgi:hypothetical protein